MTKRSIDRTWEELGSILRRSYQTHQVGFALYLAGNTHFLPLLYILCHTFARFSLLLILYGTHMALLLTR
jgi:hypothetical protein